MSAYIDAGYTVALGTLAVYASTLVVRERAARRRLERASSSVGEVVEGSAEGDDGDDRSANLP